VNLDVELKWAGDPQAVLKVGAKGIPSLRLELCDIQFNGLLRVKLGPLVGEVVSAAPFALYAS
jgi:hypothetical protein